MGVNSDIKARLDAYFAKMLKRLAQNIKQQVTLVGMKAVNKARNDGNYGDRTGNLRSSIGFAFYEEGKKLMQSAFEQVGADPAGSDAGKRMVEELAKELATTYALAVVAGMDYASYVEAKGYDVLASAELLVRAEIEKAVQRAIDNTLKAMQNEKI